MPYMGFEGGAYGAEFLSIAGAILFCKSAYGINGNKRVLANGVELVTV